MSQLTFFGPGIDSDLANRTNFRLRDPVIGAVALVNVGEIEGRHAAELIDATAVVTDVRVEVPR